MKILIESINCSYALLHIIIFQLKLFDTIFWIRSRAKDDAIYRLEPCWDILESKYLMLSETNCSKKKTMYYLFAYDFDMMHLVSVGDKQVVLGES